MEPVAIPLRAMVGWMNALGRGGSRPLKRRWLRPSRLHPSGVRTRGVHLPAFVMPFDEVTTNDFLVSVMLTAFEGVSIIGINN